MSDQASLKAELDRLHAIKKWCLKSEAYKLLGFMLGHSKSEPGVPVLPKELNRDPWLLNCVNGTLDLRAGGLREHRREDLITTLCPTPYLPDVPCPVWERTLLQIFGGNQALVAYLRRLLGYCLTGSVREQILPILWGSGSNGKSLLIETLLAMLGPDYACSAPDDLLMVNRKDTHPAVLLPLVGKRLVPAVESAEGARLNEALIKKLTGDDSLSTRGMGQNYFDFSPTHKLFLITNHQPEVRGNDHSVWRRLRLIPFTVRFWDPDKGESGPPELRADKTLKEKLHQELPGVLAWCASGTRDWLKGGMQEPAEVRAATRDYREEQNVVACFLAQRCHCEATARTRASALYKAFKDWHEAAGEPGKPLSQKKFGQEMGKTFTSTTSNGTWYVGVTLATACEREGGDAVAF